MQIFVKNLAGETTTLDVPPSTSIAALKALVLDQKSSTASSTPSEQQHHQPERPPSTTPCVTITAAAMATATATATATAEKNTSQSQSQKATPGQEEETRLIFAGRHLTQPQSTLEDYNIPASSVLHLALPAQGSSGIATTETNSSNNNGQITAKETPSSSINTASFPSATVSTPGPATSAPTPSKKKKNRCNFKDCTQAIQRIVGDCGFCGGHFCGKHRLLEDHKCSGLEDCKRESHERNKEKLNGERTVVVKGV